MDHSITFRNGDESYNTFDDWHLIAPTRPSIAPAQPKSNYVDILGANGSLDFSEALVGNPTYSDREGSWEFVVLNPGDVDQYSLFDAEDRGRYRWQKIYDRIQAAIHGRTFEVILDDDPERMYKGRLWMNEWRSNAGWSRIVINYRLRPYKYDLDGNIVWPEYAYGSGGSDDGGDEVTLAFISHPSDTSVSAGDTANFSAIVAGSNRTLVWQVSTDYGSTWTNVTRGDTYNWIGMGGISTTSILYVNTPSGSEAMSLNMYRCIASDTEGNSIISDAATLTVTDHSGAITISITSPNRTISVGQSASFYVVASTSNSGATLSYQWQEGTGIATTWRNIGDTYMYSGSQTNTLIVSTLDENGNPDDSSVYYPGGCLYRCVIRDSTGAEAISDPRTLTVTAAGTVSIVSQPANATADIGDTVTFNVVAQGDDLTYQWEYYYNGSWMQPTEEVYSSYGTWSGSRTNTLQLVTSSEMEGTYPVWAGLIVRCVITSGSTTVNSDTATLTYDHEVITITRQPSPPTGAVGDTVTMTCYGSSSTGGSLHYNWQMREISGDTWFTPTGSNISGADSDTISIVLTGNENMYMYRCVVSNMANTTSANSENVVITITSQSAPTITVQPVDKTIEEGQTATFSINASGNSITYQWQYMMNGSSTWNNFRDGSLNGTIAGSTEYRLRITTIAGSGAWDKAYIRCIVTDANSNTVTSNTVRLYVE